MQENRRESGVTEYAEKIKKKITKENMAVLVLVGILLLVIAIPVDVEKKNNGAGNKMEGTEQEVTEIQKEENYERELEERLRELLESMDGVGTARVMVVLKNSSERIVEKDIPYESEQESTVYETDDDGNKTPYVVMTRLPEVEGVTVVAEGGGSSVVQKNVTEVIEALFGIDAHKIKVVKMKKES